MGTSRCWQDNVVHGFKQSSNKKKVADRKKMKRAIICKIVKDLKAAGKPVDLQAINKKVLDQFRRRKQSQKKKHSA